jgi:prepilin-type N-terminal cleavage/methylation domain-containing protein
MKRRQAGFTLTELMVVVAIIGVLVTMAIVYMRPRVRPIDVAGRFGDLVREASRRAVALGPVQANVAVLLGSKARTQILATQSGSSVTFTLYRLQEVAPGPCGTYPCWIPIDSYAVDPNVLAVKWAPNVGDYTMSGLTNVWGTTTPPAAPGAGDFVSQCRPDGTCDSRTLFFQAALPGPDCTVAGPPLYEQCAKISIMQLGGAITTHADWY